MHFEARRPHHSLARNAEHLASPGATAPGARILIASDCPAVETVRQDVMRQNYSASVATSGRAVLETFASYDLILLDTDLPDLDGVSVSRAIRQISTIPIIAFASADETDQVLLLETGCDDCIERPYRARDLIARIKAVLRRAAPERFPALDYPAADLAGPPRPRAVPQPVEARHDAVPYEDQGNVVSVGNRLVINPALREARLDGRVLNLTRKEYDLLELLASAPGRIFNRTELMTKIWEYPAGKRINAQASRTIDTHVSSLRGKLSHRDWIANVRGVGFRLDVPGPRRADRERGVHPRLSPTDLDEWPRRRLVRPLDATESA
ncbi:response regulator transcription factor [Couchioplanes caeruleus]|uniref:Response regulator n=2 Tax=Couchioplanes caeruleus TaxID=56438 RepID=A0A1K0FS47_9ACTN|nr:response regulator transcription factor [Couchioplanes caeruleus]OJF15663.1 Response regulator [Couchioplanes caeruleus subsp. caeruleus]ROP33848.1 DNA-binding response OmpR family regulator [Couchioplanes caeruleus]